MYFKVVGSIPTVDKNFLFRLLYDLQLDWANKNEIKYDINRR